MKKISFLAVLVFAFASFYSCKDSISDFTGGDDTSLKSADVKKSYIVVLNDAGLNAELAVLSDFESKQKSVKTTAEKIMKRAGITDGEMDFGYLLSRCFFQSVPWRRVS